MYLGGAPMFCLRCGTEIKDEGPNVYCASCLANMERDPVPQGIAIQLPTRSAPPAPKRAPRKKELKPEEQLARLRSINRRLAFALVIALIAVLVAAFLLIKTLYTPQLIPMP